MRKPRRRGARRARPAAPKSGRSPAPGASPPRHAPRPPPPACCSGCARGERELQLHPLVGPATVPRHRRRRGSSSTWPPGPNVTRAAPAQPAGRAATRPPGRRPSRRRASPRAAPPWPGRRPPASRPARRGPGRRVITPTSGSAIAVSSAIWPNPRIAHLEHEHLGARRGAEHRQRQPDLGVVVLRVGDHRPVRGDQRRDQVLRRRLADRARDRDHVGAELAPPRRAQRAQRRDRVLDRDHGALAAAVARPLAAPPARPTRPPPARPRRTSRRPALARQRRRRGRRRRPRASRSPPASATAAPPRTQRRRPPPATCSALQALIPRAPRAAPRARRRRRRTAPCARRRTPGRCSWPLPAITTTSPAAASPTARSIAARRSTQRSTPAAPAGTPARISSMIASGSSERGLSDVTIATSAAAPRPRPSAGACRGRGPRPRRTRRSRGPSASSRAASSTFSSAAGLCE